MAVESESDPSYNEPNLRLGSLYVKLFQNSTEFNAYAGKSKGLLYSFTQDPRYYVMSATT